MKIWQILLGILGFALVTAILYVWGLKKSVGQGQDLQRRLIHKSAQRVLKATKKNGTIVRREVVSLVCDVKVGNIWSKQKLCVTDANAFADALLKFLCEQQYLEEISHNKYQRKVLYSKKGKENEC